MGCRCGLESELRILNEVVPEINHPLDETYGLGFGNN
jgi:hypothetical protein